LAYIGVVVICNERFYTEMIPRAVALLDAYLKENEWKESTERGGNDP
jgi:hypothetical protein